MGIRIRGNYSPNLNSSKLNENENIRGFKLKASRNTTYDLDDIFANRKRTNSESPLYIQVKNSEDIAKSVIDKFNASVELKVQDTLTSEELKSSICDIIESAMQKYGVNDVSSGLFKFALNDINSKVNALLKSKLGNNMTFTVSIEGTSKTIDINYDFTSETAFESALTSVYEKYKNEIINTNVGGVAMYGNKTGSISANSSDYRKYLTTGDGCVEPSTNQLSEAGARKPLIIWSEGTEDDTGDEEVTTIYDIINSMQKKLDYLYSYKANDIIPDAPTDDGDYCLKVHVRDGVASYVWATNNQIKINITDDGYLNAEYTNIKLIDIENQEYKNASIPDGDYKILPDGTCNFVMYRYNVEE